MEESRYDDIEIDNVSADCPDAHRNHHRSRRHKKEMSFANSIKEFIYNQLGAKGIGLLLFFIFIILIYLMTVKEGVVVLEDLQKLSRIVVALQQQQQQENQEVFSSSGLVN